MNESPASPPTETPTVVLDVDALREAVASTKRSGERLILLTTDQLETLLLVVDDNARLQALLQATTTQLHLALDTIDCALLPTEPPPAGEEDGPGPALPPQGSLPVDLGDPGLEG